MPSAPREKGVSITDACITIVWGIAALGLLWRYTGGAGDGTPGFIMGTGIGLIVIHFFFGILLCMFRFISNPPFAFIWMVLSLALTSLVVSIAVTGADLARIALGTDIPVNTAGYDLCIVTTQTIFLAGLFSRAFNAGSHEKPPPWATHRARSPRFKLSANRESEDEVVYAAAEHVIGPDPDEDPAV